MVLQNPIFCTSLVFGFSVSGSFQSENYSSSCAETIILIVSIPVSTEEDLSLCVEKPLLPVCLSTIFLYLFHQWLWKVNSCSENVILRLLTQEFSMLMVQGWTFSTSATSSAPGKVWLVQWDMQRDHTLTCPLLLQGRAEWGVTIALPNLSQIIVTHLAVC